MVVVEGWRRVLAAPAVIVGVFVVTLIAALPLALTLRASIQAHLGASLAAGTAADGVNYEWWQEYAARASGVGTTFTPSIIGFAATLDSLSSLADERPLITPVAAALALYATAWLFLYGGVIGRYARNARMGAGAFFGTSGTFLFRFIRLGVMAAFVYVVLFGSVHRWLFDVWYTRMTRDLAVEHVAFFWRLLMYAIFAALLACTATVFDYAKIRAVVEDRRSMIGALRAALRFIARRPGRVARLYAANALTFAVVLGVWLVAAPGAGGAGPSMWAGVAATQFYIVARLLVRLQFIASETALFLDA
jgi:hypothetical protein